MKYAELPANLKAAVDRQIGAPAKQHTGKGGGSSSGGQEWRCVTCAETFTQWSKVEKHDPSHRRIDCVVHLGPLVDYDPPQ